MVSGMIPVPRHLRVSVPSELASSGVRSWRVPQPVSTLYGMKTGLCKPEWTTPKAVLQRCQENATGYGVKSTSEETERGTTEWRLHNITTAVSATRCRYQRPNSFEQ